MVILLLKALQPGLFEKLVPVAGSVSATGVVTKPHMAVRHVRALAPKPAKPHHVQADLFGEAPRAQEKPAPKPTKPAAPPSGDLFAERPAPTPEQAEADRRTAIVRRLSAEQGGPRTIAQRKADAKSARKNKPSAEAVAAAHAALDAAREADNQEPNPQEAIAPAGINYDRPFDEISVPAFGVSAGTSKEARRKINADAAHLVDMKSDFTPADLALLRQYSGNGGCGDSLNEFYTDPHVAAAMWKVLTGLGIGSGANVLEPSCATGVFLETAPTGVKVTGVELDTTSAKIGRALHPQHEVENASLERFATTDERAFDAVIGNAPFGLRGSLIKDDKPRLKTAEGYFLDTALDKTRAGGIVAMIVPTGVLDSRRDRSLREHLLRKGEFLGALRMPNTAFEHSHTGVTTDVVFFRKRPDDVAAALAVVDQAGLQRLGVWDEDYLSGGYFEGRGAANVLGTMTEGWRAKAGMGEDITVEGSMVGVPEAISEFAPESVEDKPVGMAEIMDAAPDEDAREKIRGAAAKRPYDKSKRGDVKIVEGVEYILEGEPLRWHRVDEFAKTADVREAVDLAADIERAMEGRAPEGLAERVKAWVEKYGNPSKNQNLQLAATQDKSLYRLIGAVKPDGSLSDVVEGRRAEVLESSFDAAATSLALEYGSFTPQMVAARWHGGDAEAALDHLYAGPEYALDPETGEWSTIDQYLTGDLWPKLDTLKAAAEDPERPAADRAKFQRQAVATEEAIDPKALEDVEVQLNSAFLPLKVVAAFFNERNKAAGGWAAKQPELVLTFDRGVYAGKGGGYDTQLLLKYLNREGIKKDKDLPTIERWNQEFKEWLCGSGFRDEVEELYNRNFRGFRQRGYSDTPFEVPGLNAEGLKSYQWSGVRWALEAGKGIIAADVGLGKTARGLIVARMLKMTGKARKPMLVIPKSVAVNWVAEIEKWFPGASYLVIGETVTRGKDGEFKGKEDSAAERDRKYHDLTQNDYDFVLITQPSWNDLDLDPEMKAKYVDDDFWTQRADSLGQAGDKRTRQIRERYEQSIAGREFEKRTGAIYFNDLGVDALLMDEGHAYKNLFAARNRFGQSPKFLGGQGLSNRALDTNLKTRFVRERADGQNVYMLTATPTKNSPLEIYSMLSHIAPEAFERIGIRNSEEFLDRFCEFQDRNILNTQGKIEEALCVTGFKNLGELREIMRRYIDRKTAADVGLELPERDDRQHLIDMSDEQKTVYAELREKADKAKQKDSTGDAHIFSIMDKMGKAALDLELYDPAAYAGARSPLYEEAVKHIADGAKEGGQVVFCESLAAHEKMRDALVAAGIPKERIAIFNAQAAASSSKRQNISDAFNAGKLDVVIGNSTMSEGVNLQKRTTDIHHLDLPWEPASMQQRNGRGLRQGNINEAVRIHTYLPKGSFYGYRYQTIAAKKDWQDLLWNGGDRVDNLALEGAMSREDMMVMLAEDPDAARKQLDENKAAAKAKFEATKHAEAAEQFVNFRAMTRSFAKLKGKDREKPSGERLRVKIERARASLEANPYFKAKHALDGTSDVLVQPNTGMVFEPGRAFEVAPDESKVRDGGKYVVTGVFPSHNLVRARRYGSTSGQVQFELDSLGHGVTEAEYDKAAEEAVIAEQLKSEMANKPFKKYEDLRGMPPALLEASHADIQAKVKQGLSEHGFHLPYDMDVPLVDREGKLKTVPSYQARSMLDAHDVLLPTEAHKKLARDAYLADERAMKWGTEYVSSGRSRSRYGSSHSVVVPSYPGERYGGNKKNRWASVLKEVFGEDALKDAHAEYERGQFEAARRAPNMREAITAAAHTAKTEYGSAGTIPRKGLAVLWVKAKKLGQLDEPLGAVTPSGLPPGLFSGVGGHVPLREALARTAAKEGHADMAAAMIVDGSRDPQQTVKELLDLPHGSHTAPAILHMLAKHPELAERRASEFTNVHPGRPAYSYGGTAEPAHPLYQRFGERARTMTLADLDDTDGDERRAA